MANVTSSFGQDMTVIVLNAEETEALADLLEVSDPEDNMVLDELTNAMLGERHCIEPVTNWNKPEPSWKDEPSSDYRFGRG
jgi:hypothetical protein